MEYRKRSTITIYRNNEELVSVPITQECKRIFKLMKEDCIKLVFILATPIELRINDYIDDEVFGRFYIAKKQTGTWNPKDGVYKYDIEFVAEYMLWANYEYMYTSQEILRVGTESGDVIRKESIWFFTAKLKDHLNMVIANLRVLGFEYNFEIHHDATGDDVYHNDVKESEEVKFENNKPQSIIDALNKLAEDYECEWWVERKVIHFGKCVHGEEITISPQEHLSNFSIKDNRKDYCNVIRAYGGDKNIPTSYRKNLYLFIDYSFEYNGTTYWIDSSKKLSKDFFRVYDEDFTLHASPFRRGVYTDAYNQYRSDGVWHKALAKSCEYNVTLPGLSLSPPQFEIENFSGKARKAKGILTAFLEYEYETSVPLGEWETEELTITTRYVTGFKVLTVPKKVYNMVLKRGQRFRISFIYRCEIQLYLTTAEKLIGSPDFCTFTGDVSVPGVSINSGKSVMDVTYYENGEYIDTQINLSTIRYTRPDNSDVILYGLTTVVGETRENVLKNGRIFLVHTDDNVDIPQAYYLDSLDDPSNIARLGSRRLRLPVYDSNGYLTNGVIADREEETISDFDERLCLARLDKTDSGTLLKTEYTIFPVRIEWEKFCEPLKDIDGNPLKTYHMGNITISGLSVGDEVLFGNSLENGIKNMIRWAVIDKNGYVVESSKECNSIKENTYVVGKDCDKIICSHYNTNIPYVKIGRSIPIRSRVEKTIIFDDIYPKMHLYVKDIKTTKRTDKETFEGESEETKEWNWLEYTITLQTYDGVEYKDFRFKNKYILQDEKLQIQFLYPGALEGLENTGSPCKLAGMIFDVQHINDGETSSFKILRNEDFGAKLPSDLLCPSAKDPCTLIGWNIKAVQSTGIIEAAEQKLYNLAKEYKNALEDNPYTFECTLFAHFITEHTSEMYFAESGGRVVICSDGKYLIVNNHILLTQGQKIRIQDPTLHNKECKSRVIGYEYKLDIPWDSPKITVGETDAYSRLAKIEKEIKSS